MAYAENADHVRIPVASSATQEIELSWYGMTDIGRRRETNQDSYLARAPIFAVADGMGGHAAGEVAATAVTERLTELARTGAVTHDGLVEALVAAIHDMTLRAEDADESTGTTVTGMYLTIENDTPVWEVFNIGDSRVYQYLNSELRQVTLDHSVVQHLIDTGQITPEEAEYHPHSNVITRAVGLGEDPIPDFTRLDLVPGQRILVCSDGLTKELTDIGIQHFLATTATAKDAAEQLMKHALENAGRDNISVVVVDVHAVIERSGIDPQRKETTP